jgi:hypothetical protein
MRSRALARRLLGALVERRSGSFPRLARDLVVAVAVALSVAAATPSPAGADALDYEAAVMADSPRAYWKFQELSGLPQDSSGNGLHWTSWTRDRPGTTGRPAVHWAGRPRA